MSSTSEITQLLVKLKDGQDGIYDQLYPLVYDRLKSIANMHMNRQGQHTLSRTELVHEAYLKMIDQTEVNYSNRNHFLGIASHCMRQILIDYARKKHAQKRGGKNKDLTFIDEVFNAHAKQAKELIDIDDALIRLSQLDERLGKVVEMRFFGEMSIEETAGALDISESTVKRDWLKAKGWLYKELKGRFEVE